jgi:hypothetical protein
LPPGWICCLDLECCAWSSIFARGSSSLRRRVLLRGPARESQRVEPYSIFRFPFHLGTLTVVSLREAGVGSRFVRPFVVSGSSARRRFPHRDFWWESPFPLTQVRFSCSILFYAPADPWCFRCRFTVFCIRVECFVLPVSFRFFQQKPPPSVFRSGSPFPDLGLWIGPAAVFCPTFFSRFSLPPSRFALC